MSKLLCITLILSMVSPVVFLIGEDGVDIQSISIVYPKPFDFDPDLYTAPFFKAYIVKDFNSEDTGVSTYGLAPSDFNGDGYLDFAVGWRSLSDNHGHITVFYGRDDGGFEVEDIRDYCEEDEIGRTRITIEDLDAADFNNDGYPDIIGVGEGSAIRNGSEIRVFPVFIIWNNATRGFVEDDYLVTEFTREGDWINPHITVADFDRDGDIDFVVGANCGKIKLFKNKGDGSFQDIGVVAFDYGYASWGLDTGDFNGDGYPDLVVCAATEGDINFTDAGHIYIKLNDKSERCFNSSSPGIFVASLPPPIDYTIGALWFGSIAVLDYNRDGLLDIVYAGDWSMYMYIQQKKYMFKPFRACLFRAKNLSWADHLHEGGFAVGDFNNDGWNDLVVGGVMGVVRLLLNNKTFVYISVPEDRWVYLFGNIWQHLLFPSQKIVIGPINVTVDPIEKISRVDFYLNGKLVYSDSEEPFEWIWRKIGFGKYKLTVEGFDEEGKTVGRDNAIVWKFL